MSNHPPTITDVAKRAYVSKSTVSHVINGTRTVEEETKRRVLNAIRDLQYRPNKVARSLTTKRTGTIGMIVSDASNQFFGELLRGVEDILRPANYALILCNTDEALEREEHYLNLLLGQRVEGIIAAATSQNWSALALAEASHTPIVFVDRRFEGLPGPYIGADNAGGAYKGTRHLIACGYREIGILAGFQRLSTMRERLQGFQAALDEAGLPLPEEWVVASGTLTVENGREACRHILGLPHPPKALFVNNNLLTLGALLEITAMGLRCPEDVALVGFDDHPWAAVCAPPLTVVSQQVRKTGQAAANMLCTLLDGGVLESDCVQLECELLLRQSC